MPPSVQPSARYQVPAGSVTPTESWAQVRELPYMARSQMTSPPLACTRVETSQSVTKSPASKETREFGATAKSWGPGTAPCEVMKVRSTVTASVPGFCTSIQVSMPPSVQPSARYQTNFFGGSSSAKVTTTVRSSCTSSIT